MSASPPRGKRSGAPSASASVIVGLGALIALMAMVSMSRRVDERADDVSEPPVPEVSEASVAAGSPTPSPTAGAGSAAPSTGTAAAPSVVAPDASLEVPVAAAPPPPDRGGADPQPVGSPACRVDSDCDAVSFCEAGICASVSTAAANVILGHHRAYIAGDAESYFGDYAPVLECFYRVANYDRDDIVSTRRPAFEGASREYDSRDVRGTALSRHRAVVTEWHTFGGTSGTKGWVVERSGGRWRIVAESSRSTAACFPHPEFLDPGAR